MAKSATKKKKSAQTDLFELPPPRKAKKSAARGKAPARVSDGSYTAADIEVLEGLEPVRRRPGMYIGGTDEKALHHLFAEVIDNSMDEALAGHATWIEVEMEANGYRHRHRQRPRHSGRSASEVHEASRRSKSSCARCTPAANSTPRSTRRRAACTASASRWSTRCPSSMEVEVARDQTLWTDGVRARQAERQAHQSRPRSQSARHQGALPARPADFRRQGALRSRARLFKMARSKAYLFGGVEIRWYVRQRAAQGSRTSREKP